MTPKSAEHKRKLSEASRAKWADPDHRSAMLEKFGSRPPAWRDGRKMQRKLCDECGKEVAPSRWPHEPMCFNDLAGFVKRWSHAMTIKLDTGCVMWEQDRPRPRLPNKDRVNRVVLELKLGRKLTEDEMSCHSCDEPKCVNWWHLWPGTAKDNAQDMIMKGRAAWQKQK